MEIGQLITTHQLKKISLVHKITSFKFNFIIIQVHPKKTFVELVEKKNDIKITSNISIEGLKIVGSWDNWKE